VSRKDILASAKSKKFGHHDCSELVEGVLVVKIKAPSPYEMVDWFNYFTANFGF